MLQHNPKLYAEAHSLNGLHYSPFGAVVHLVQGVGTYLVRCRGTASLGAGVLPRSVQRYCPARCRGTDPLGSGVAIRSDQRYESAFKQLHISPTFAPQTRIKTRLGFQRAGRATRFEQGEQLASSGASNSLRAGRATRSERGEQLASSRASNSLRAGRATRPRLHRKRA